MEIIINDKDIILKGNCTIEDSEKLLNTLSEHNIEYIYLNETEFIHTAIFQIILCSNLKIKTYPANKWIKTMLEQKNT